MAAIYQSFEDKSEGAHGASRLKALRSELKRRNLDGFIIPRTDEHQNEYVPPHDERLAWLTGFTGSWGLAIALTDEAAIFVDGRYTVQVREQVDGAAFTPMHLIDTPPDEWLETHLSAGARLGYDPNLHTIDGVKRLERAVAKAGATLVAVDTNPVDSVWPNQPPAPLAPVILHPAALAGAEASDKLVRIREKIAGLRADAVVITDPHALAWAFNIRGGDVSHTPLPLGYAVVPREGEASIFLDGRKLSNSVRDELSRLGNVLPPTELDDTLKAIAAGGGTVRFDQATASSRLVRLVEEAGGKADVGPDPVALMKAAKNAAELAGTRAAHIRDGAAMTNFLCWFAREAPKGGLTEISAAEALEECRRNTGALKDVSFPSISGAGPNAALPHYRVSTTSNRKIEQGIYLIDSGGQYEDGTTDITRTLAVGEPTAEMKDRFSRVLKGMIAISRSVFPKGTSGAQIDSFARRALWEIGTDFDHGTGHGVGTFLSVHEGPQRISKLGTTPFEPGMILSNEPGYYKAGAYGIRIENLVVIEHRDIPGAERTMYGFETITFAPIDLTLVDIALLTTDERDWLNAYHADVLAKIGPLVEGGVKAWLEGATRAI